MEDILQSFREFSVSIYGNLEQFNDVISKARARVFYKYDNRNGTYITDEFAQKLIQSLPYTPIKGIHDGEDYTDHGYSRSLGRIYGIVPENPNFSWEKHLDEDGIEREYACTDVLLFTALYSEADSIVGKSLSMELYEKTLAGDWQFINNKKQFVFTEGCFLGLQVLGNEVEPCFEGAAFFSLYQSLTDMIEKINSFNLNYQKNRLGGKEMSTNIFKLSDNDKFDFIFELLNPNYNEENNWDLDFHIIDIYDQYALVYSCKKKHYERAYYTKNDETDSVSIDKMELCFIIDVTEQEKLALDAIQAINGGTYENLENNFTSKEEVKEFELKIEELNTLNSTLVSEKEEAISNYTQAQELLEESKLHLEEVQTAFNELQVNFEELAQYKRDVENTHKQEIIQTYTELLDEEILMQFNNNIENYSVEELDKELAYEVKKTNPSVFSNKKDFSAKLPKDQMNGGLEAILSHYVK